MTDKFKRFIPITKVDDDERMVYGWASTPALDSDGEIVSIDAIKGALPEYLQFPTIREMHQAKAAGTTKTAEIMDNETGKGLYIGAKIIADDAWKMVKEGVYKGFSIGGHILTKVENVITGLDLVEISLVDVPANKEAKIELWKSKDKVDMKKDANGVTMYADLMSHIKWLLMCCDPTEDKSQIKLLNKMLEQVKGLVGQEASEAEPEVGSEATGMFLSKNPDDIEKTLKSLKAMEFGDNKIAEALRKGVIIAMQKNKKSKVAKDEEVKETEVKAEVKADEAKAEETKETKTTDGEKTETKTETKEEVVPEVKEETKEEVKDEESAKDETSEEKKEVKTEEKESDEEEKESSETPTLTKMNEISKKLDKLVPVEKTEKLSLEKTVQAMASNISKVVTYMETLEARLQKVESTPAALKSKAVFVHKSTEDTPDIQEVKKNDELVTKEARMVELNKLYNELGASKFAKKGYSQEAGVLEREIEALKLKSQREDRG